MSEITYIDLDGDWIVLKESPEETISYFKEKFQMVGKFVYNPLLEGYGQTKFTAFRGFFCMGFKLSGITLCAEIGKSAFEGKNHWLDLVLNMWHEEHHQMFQSFLQFVSRSPRYELAAWDYAFKKAKQFSISEEMYSHQFKFWRMTREYHMRG